MLDKRLQMCADMISGTGIVCDVGTDHAYLAAELILSGKCKKVIASDVKKGPLEAAAKTVEKYGVDDKVELILSDGLENVALDGVSDIVIAGMGGETIIEILGKCSQIIANDIHLILQPMTKEEVLRKWLYDHNFVINSEKLVEDGDKIYTVMQSSWGGEFRKLTESEAWIGFFDETDKLTKKYRKNLSERLAKVSLALEKAEKRIESVHFNALSRKLADGVKSVSINEIYDYLDSVYPFKSQEKWDNSGLLIENLKMDCSKVLLTLDIDHSACYEAECKEAELIISHHPVIFEPLKRISYNNPVYRLVESGIAAICMHTNVDKAPNGTNGVILHKLAESFELEGQPEIFEDCGDGLGIGYVCELKNKIDSAEFGAALKEIFDCEVVRTNSLGKKRVKRLAFCSGSGGSMLGEAIERGCDAYVTGDIKHDVWIEANNRHIALFDCGHFHTENPVLDEIRFVLEKKFPQLDVIISESSVDPVQYIR